MNLMKLLNRPLIAFEVACVLSAALTLVLVRLSAKLRLITKPNGERWQKQPMPNSGGIAIVVACITVYALGVHGRQHLTVMGLGVAIALLGFVDDRIELHPLVKFSGQAVAAIAAIALTARWEHWPTPWGLVNLFLIFLWIVGITNAFNLIDNMDGLCAGVTIIICGSRFIFAASNGDSESALLLAIIAGGFLGFLIFNYKPAKIFMGDGGSMFAGFTLATLAVSSPVPQSRVIISGLIYATLSFLYPIFDTVLVSVLRRLAGRPITVGGRDHSSHRLASLGLDERKVVWLLWGLTAMSSAAGVLTSSMPVGIGVIGILLGLGVGLFGVFLGTLPEYPMPEIAPARSHRVRKLIPTLRAGASLIVDVLLAGEALFCAFLVLWGNSPAGNPISQLPYLLPMVMAAHGLVSILFRSYRCGWRWFGIRDVVMLGRCVVMGSVLVGLILWVFGLQGYWLEVLPVYAILLMSFVVGVRAFLRLLWHTLVPHAIDSLRVAVLGASSAGELAIQILQKKRGLGAHPVLVLETDPALSHTTIHGVPVHHPGSDPLRLVRQNNIDVLIVPSDGPLGPAEAAVIAACQSGGLDVRSLDLALRPLQREPSKVMGESRVKADHSLPAGL